jgi:VWFA-related protein
MMDTRMAAGVRRMSLKLPLFLSFALCAAMSLPSAQQQQPIGGGLNATYTVRTQLVQIYMTVTEGGRRVNGLKASEFSLTEDGVPKEIAAVDSETVPLQVALLLDTSESMRNALPFVQEAAAYLVESLRPMDRVTLIPFSTDVRSIPQLMDDHGAILQAIRATEARGTTRLYDALLYAMKYLSGKNGRKAIVSFSDGEDTARTSSLQVVLNAAARYGFPIYTVGAGAGLEREPLKRILRQLAEINSGRMFFQDDPGALRAVFEEVAAELRSAYVLNYYTQVPFDARWHDVQIRLSNSGYSIRCRKGFYSRSGPASGLVDDNSDEHSKSSSSAQGGQARQIQSETARAAEQELLQPPVEVNKIESNELRALLPPSAVKPKDSDAPQFKVETRLVEVPVLIESVSGKEMPPLGAKDFRAYEDDALRQIDLFIRAADEQELTRLRADAVQKLGETRSFKEAPRANTEQLTLGRFYLVLDDMMTDAGSFLWARSASEKIITEYYRPERPISLHLTSQTSAEIASRPDLTEMMQRLRAAVPHSLRELTATDGLMTTYQAYLIEQGDREATETAELKYAHTNSLTFQNSLGAVEGIRNGDPVMIRRAVESKAREMTGLNNAQALRALTGLQVVVSAAAAEPGNMPKGIVFLSSSFTMGRMNPRADIAALLDELIATARRNGVRLYTVDASGLTVPETVGIESDGALSVTSMRRGLATINDQSGREWQRSREGLMARLATETGGKFSRNTNDLAAASGAALHTSGQLYYLGFLSLQPPDGRFHRIRITVSSPGVRVYAREGYYASPHSGGEVKPDPKGVDEPWEALLARATQASRDGDPAQMATTVEKLVQKFPNHAGLWYNLGAARLKLGDGARAVEALQRAYALSPEEKVIGSTLARALVAAGFRDAAADVMEQMMRKHPLDLELIVDMGRILEADGRTEQAYRVYRRALDCTLVPPLQLYLLLTRCAVSLGRQAEAELFIRDYQARGGDPAAIDRWRRSPATGIR